MLQRGGGSIFSMASLPALAISELLIEWRPCKAVYKPRVRSSLTTFGNGRVGMAMKKRDKRIRAALDDSSSSKTEVFQGMYGPWSIDSNDVREVLLYRAGLVTTAVAFITAASQAFLPENNFLHSTIEHSSDILYGIGAGGLGISLLLIHIYVTPIKRALQLLWAGGVLGSVVVALKFAAPVDESLVNYVLQNRWAIWLIGPLFASLTGLVFKEGLCYGKLEAAILVFVIPTLLLGHLSGLSDGKIELPLLLAWMTLYTVFTARKFTQPIKDDLGDKSIFMFNALPEEEKQSFLVNLQGRNRTDGDEQSF